MKMTKLTLTAAAIALAVTLLGCAGTTYQSKTRMPALDMGTALKGVPVKVFLVHKFTDERGVAPTALSGNMKLDQPLAEAFGTAVRREFERNGHKCISTSSEGKPDFVLDGSVVQLGMNFARPSGLSGTLNVDAAMKLVFHKAEAPGSEYAKKYAGAGQVSTAGPLTTSLAFGAVDQAILSVLREFSTDPSLSEYLTRGK